MKKVGFCIFNQTYILICIYFFYNKTEIDRDPELIFIFMLLKLLAVFLFYETISERNNIEKDSLKILGIISLCGYLKFLIPNSTVIFFTFSITGILFIFSIISIILFFRRKDLFYLIYTVYTLIVLWASTINIIGGMIGEL